MVLKIKINITSNSIKVYASLHFEQPTKAVIFYTLMIIGYLISILIENRS